MLLFAVLKIMKRRKTEPHSPQHSASPENVPSHDTKKDLNEESGNAGLILEQDRFLPIGMFTLYELAPKHSYIIST